MRSTCGSERQSPKPPTALDEQHDSEMHSHGTRELLQALEGSLTIAVGGDRYDLAPGEALSFHGDVPHAYVNSNDAATRFSLTVFEPNVGAEVRRGDNRTRRDN